MKEEDTDVDDEDEEGWGERRESTLWHEEEREKERRDAGNQ